MAKVDLDIVGQLEALRRYARVLTRDAFPERFNRSLVEFLTTHLDTGNR